MSKVLEYVARNDLSHNPRGADINIFELLRYAEEELNHSTSREPKKARKCREVRNTHKPKVQQVTRPVESPVDGSKSVNPVRAEPEPSVGVVHKKSFRSYRGVFRKARTWHYRLTRGRHEIRPVQYETNSFQGSCYNCGYLGHSQNYCPIKQCCRCRAYGHSSKVCAEIKQHKKRGCES